MIHFSKQIELGEVYSKWVVENRLQDCPATVIHFLQVKGLLNEEKTHNFLAVKTNTVIDGTGSTKSNYFKEDVIMAKDDVKDLAQVKPDGVPPTTDGEKPKKEFFLKRLMKGAWDGVCKLGKAVKESPITHVVMAGAGVAGTLVVEEAIRRHANKSAGEDYEDEPIEIPDDGEVDITDLPEVEDEVTEE